MYVFTVHISRRRSYEAPKNHDYSCCYRDRDIVDGLWASVVRASTKHLSQGEADSIGSFFGEPRKRACLRLNAF